MSAILRGIPTLTSWIVGKGPITACTIFDPFALAARSQISISAEVYFWHKILLFCTLVVNVAMENFPELSGTRTTITCTPPTIPYADSQAAWCRFRQIYLFTDGGVLLRGALSHFAPGSHLSSKSAQHVTMLLAFVLADNLTAGRATP